MGNIRLRPIIKEDLEILNSWRNNESIFKFLGGGFMPVSKDIQSKWIENMMDTTGTDKRFIIETKDFSKPIGLIGLYNINWVHRTFEVGLFIGEREEMGQGYAKSAYYILEKLAKSYLNLRKAKLYVVKANQRATKLWTSVGFESVGKFVKDRYIDGEYYDVILMEKFLEEDYK